MEEQTKADLVNAIIQYNKNNPNNQIFAHETLKEMEAASEEDVTQFIKEIKQGKTELDTDKSENG